MPAPPPPPNMRSGRPNTEVCSNLLSVTALPKSINIVFSAHKMDYLNGDACCASAPQFSHAVHDDEAGQHCPRIKHE